MTNFVDDLGLVTEIKLPKIRGFVLVAVGKIIYVFLFWCVAIKVIGMYGFKESLGLVQKLKERRPIMEIFEVVELLLLLAIALSGSYFKTLQN